MSLFTKREQLRAREKEREKQAELVLFVFLLLLLLLLQYLLVCSFAGFLFRAAAAAMGLLETHLAGLKLDDWLSSDPSVLDCRDFG